MRRRLLLSIFAIFAFSLTLKSQCQAYFSYKVKQNQVLFLNHSMVMGNAPAYSWVFGDGNATSEVAPKHIYSQNGTYQVCLTVLDENGCVDTHCETIRINFTNDAISQPDTFDFPTFNTCRANFQYNIDGKHIQFANTSNATFGDIQSIWDFGDGNISTEKNPNHQYHTYGTYLVRLRIQSEDCVSSIEQSITISPCQASFIVALDTGISHTIFLINNSSKSPEHEYQWTFGDGGVASGRTPFHQYNEFGLHQVCLTVSNTVLGCSNTYCDSMGIATDGRLILKSAAYSIHVIDEDALGVEEQSLADELTLYPNPTNGNVRLNWGNWEKNLQYRLYDPSGKLIEEGQLDANRQQQDFNMEAYENGIYLLQITDGKTNVLKKIVKNG